MDTTETYIKMCEKAEEIQEGIDDGSLSGRFVGGNIIYSIAPTNQPHDRDGYYNVTDKEAVRRCEACGNEESYIKSSKYVWLPRQDQLQEMIDSWWKRYGAYGEPLIKGFYDFAMFYNPKPFRENELPVNSWEQLWLAFVMHNKYKKEWDGEDWISENKQTS